jgi:hypothetical protein
VRHGERGILGTSSTASFLFGSCAKLRKKCGDFMTLRLPIRVKERFRRASKNFVSEAKGHKILVLVWCQFRCSLKQHRTASTSTDCLGFQLLTGRCSIVQKRSDGL